MKFNELKNKVARVAVIDPEMEQYYQIERCPDVVFINNLESHTRLYAISNTLIGSFDETSEARFIPAAQRLALQKLAYKYSRTPLDKRENEPKFRVRMLPNDSESYLNLDEHHRELFIEFRDEAYEVKTVFTQSEYDELQQEYPEWLPKFNKDDPHFEIVEGENDD